MQNSYVIYEGLSVLDNQPIVVIASGFANKSANDKTGNMIQTFILRSDVEPHQAVKTGDDSSVCGNCVHRPANGGACYVKVFQAPLSVFRAWKRGNIPKLPSNDLFADKLVRFGSYGDPAAVPVSVLKAIKDVCAGSTGYTHQTAHKNFDNAVLDYRMVSADTPKQAKKHHEHKLRTFRVKVEGAPLLYNEIECLADSKGLTCAECKLCETATSDAPNIAINVHGATKKRYSDKFSKVNFA